MRTNAVKVRTVLLLARFRYHLTTTRGDQRWDTIAEDTLPLAFAGSPEVAHWLDDAATTALLDATPSGNVDPGQARHTLERLLEQTTPLQDHLDTVAHDRADRLLQAHRRVRTAADLKGLRYAVEPLLPADVLGAYVLLPA